LRTIGLSFGKLERRNLIGLFKGNVMIKITSDGAVSLGKPRLQLPQEDLDEISRMFERFEHEMLFEDEGDDYDGQTVIYGESDD
jgi:hypothetical protein